jgi:hypothetical protein
MTTPHLPHEDLTHFPAINDFLRAAHRFEAGELDRQSLAESLKAAHRHLRQTLAVFEQQSRYRERTPLMQRESPRIRDSAKLAISALEPLVVSSSEPHEITAQQLERARAQVLEHCGALARSLEALRVEEAAMPIYSRSPYMHTLMRLAVGVQARTIDTAVLADSLTEMLRHVRGYAANLDGMARPGREAALYAERRAHIVEVSGRLERRLQTAQHYLQVSHLDAVLSSLKEACEQAELLMLVLDEITGLEQARRTRPCMRCGSPNERSARHCSKCSAQLPPMVDESDVDALVDLEISDTVRQAGHIDTEWTRQLNHVVAERLEGSLSDEAFTSALDACEAPIERGKQELERLPVVPGLEGEELEAVQAAQNQLRSGIEWVLEGIQIMRRHVLDGNTSHLENGLERALVGADHVFAIKLAADTLKASQAS